VPLPKPPDLKCRAIFGSRLGRRYSRMAWAGHTTK